MPTNKSVSLYNTFGNELKYRINSGTVEAYLENSTIKFPLPEASSDILGGLVVQGNLNPEQVDQCRLRLIKLGFKESKATVMAQILVQVALTIDVHPFSFFDDKDSAVKLTRDGYDTMNRLRPKGNRVGLTNPINNSKSRFKDIIKP